MKALSKYLGTLMVLSFFFSPSNMNANNPIVLDYTPAYFYDGNYEAAKAKAGSEGKLFLVDFYAAWCTPCKWMDRTTFSNNEIIDILDNDFVSIKVDIDEKEGYNLKEKYGVTMLPTILIFNSQGKMVERIEKTLTAESLNAILTFHNHEQNKIVIKHNINVSPSSPSTPAIETNENLDKLYREYQKREERKSSYRVQVGYYSEYEEAFNQVNEMREDFVEPIIVLNDFRDGATHYKVLIGEFITMEEAESFRIILQNTFHIDGIVY